MPGASSAWHLLSRTQGLGYDTVDRLFEVAAALGLSVARTWAMNYGLPEEPGAWVAGACLLLAGCCLLAAAAGAIELHACLPLSPRVLQACTTSSGSGGWTTWWPARGGTACG
jgi:hypothetical protein